MGTEQAAPHAGIWSRQHATHAVVHPSAVEYQSEVCRETALTMFSLPAIYIKVILYKANAQANAFLLA